MMRFSAAISPFTLPPLARSITGNRSVSTRLPATTTSDLRKKTTVSPSVCAAGWCRISIPSSLKYIARRRSLNDSLGSAAVANETVWPAPDEAPIRIRARHARDIAAGSRDRRVAADDIRIGAGVDDVANRLAGELCNSSHDGIGRFGGARVHQHDAVRT